jgi:hypothetical protein
MHAGNLCSSVLLGILNNAKCIDPKISDTKLFCDSYGVADDGGQTCLRNSILHMTDVLESRPDGISGPSIAKSAILASDVVSRLQENRLLMLHGRAQINDSGR